MRYNEIISEDDPSGDYRQMTNFISRNKTPGVPADQQVALALYRELQKQQRQNNELSAELSAAEKRIDIATQSGELSQQELGLHRGELDSERQAIDKQRDTISKIDQQYSAREKASDEQISNLTSQLEIIKDKPGVSSAAAKELEKKIQEIQKNGVGADKYQELEQTVIRMQSMQQVDDSTLKDLVTKVQDAQSKAEELGKTKQELARDLEKTHKDAQSQIDDISQELYDLRKEQDLNQQATVNVIRPQLQDIGAKVSELDGENEHIFQELGQHDAVLRKLAPGQIGGDGEGGAPVPTTPKVPPAPPRGQPATRPEYSPQVAQQLDRIKPGLGTPPVVQPEEQEAMAENKFFQAVRWATGK